MDTALRHHVREPVATDQEKVSHLKLFLADFHLHGGFESHGSRQNILEGGANGELGAIVPRLGHRRKGMIARKSLEARVPEAINPAIPDMGVADRINSYKELRVYQSAMEAAMKIFQLTSHFPQEEKYSMVDQMRRSSRSVCANIAEAWRKRRYKAAFIAKLSDAESEACETQVWIEFAGKCHYLDEAKRNRLDKTYDQVMGQLVRMIDEADKWLIR